MLKSRASAQLTAWAFLAPIAIYVMIFYGYPLFSNINLSLRNYTVEAFVAGNAQFVGLSNYSQIFGSPTFSPALIHTGIFTLASITFQFVIGLALALFFYQNFRLAMTLRALFLIPWLLPLIVSGSTVTWMMNAQSGVIDATLGAAGIGPVNWLTSPNWALASVTLTNIWLGIPFNLVILYSGLQNIPTEIYEAAKIDGASSWRSFRSITFPLLRPVSAIAILLGLIYTLKTFDIIWIMTKGGPGDASTTLATWSYQFGFGSSFPQFSPGAAVGNILIVIALIFGLIYARSRRHLEEL